MGSCGIEGKAVYAFPLQLYCDMQYTWAEVPCLAQVSVPLSPRSHVQALTVPGPGGSLHRHPLQQAEPAGLQESRWETWQRHSSYLNIFVPTSLWVCSSHVPEFTNPHQTLGSIPKRMWKRLAVTHAEKSDCNYSATNLNVPGRTKSWQHLAQDAYFQTAAYFCTPRNKIKVTHEKGSRHSIELRQEARVEAQSNTCRRRGKASLGKLPYIVYKQDVAR